MEYAAALLFAMAVSADGFAAGVAYGTKRITIPVLPLLVIAVSSTAAVTISMVCGTGLAVLLNPRWASYLGALLLIAMGGYFLLGACRKSHNQSYSLCPLYCLFQVRFKLAVYSRYSIMQSKTLPIFINTIFLIRILLFGSEFQAEKCHSCRSGYTGVLGCGKSARILAVCINRMNYFRWQEICKGR